MFQHRSAVNIRSRAASIVGHEPVGAVKEVGLGVVGYEPGDRVIVGAITPCGQCRACLSGAPSQCSHMGDGYEAIGGWRFGNTINGCQAEYVLVPNAQANLAKIPGALRDEEVGSARTSCPRASPLPSERGCG